MECCDGKFLTAASYSEARSSKARFSPPRRWGGVLENLAQVHSPVRWGGALENLANIALLTYILSPFSTQFCRAIALLFVITVAVQFLCF